MYHPPSAPLVPPSGLCYANRFGLHFLLALEEVMSKNGANATLIMSGLRQFVHQYPPDDLRRGFDIAYIASICQGLEDMAGRAQGRSISKRAGREMFSERLPAFYDIIPALKMRTAASYQALALHAQVEAALPLLDQLIISFDSPHRGTIIEKPDHFVYTMHQCPACFGRSADSAHSAHGGEQPMCACVSGMLDGGLKWFTGRYLEIVESQCRAHGYTHCVFEIYGASESPAR
ncbi:MAG: hypothetical protein HXY40_03295 [Chloroflexi bacterium]|nr:hypothetical protein [Chloroflexota bacterium]